MSPLYEFRCQECGETMELFQHMGDSPPEQCRRCEGPVKKMWSRSSFRLSGEGWFGSLPGGPPMHIDDNKGIDVGDDDD